MAHARHMSDGLRHVRPSARPGERAGSTRHDLPQPASTPWTLPHTKAETRGYIQLIPGLLKTRAIEMVTTKCVRRGLKW